MSDERAKECIRILTAELWANSHTSSDIRERIIAVLNAPEETPTGGTLESRFRTLANALLGSQTIDIGVYNAVVPKETEAVATEPENAIFITIPKSQRARFDTYLAARFPKDGQHCESFMFEGHRWQYLRSAFDDEDSYHILWRPKQVAPEPTSERKLKVEDWVDVQGATNSNGPQKIIGFTLGSLAYTSYHFISADGHVRFQCDARWTFCEPPATTAAPTDPQSFVHGGGIEHWTQGTAPAPTPDTLASLNIGGTPKIGIGGKLPTPAPESEAAGTDKLEKIARDCRIAIFGQGGVSWSATSEKTAEELILNAIRAAVKDATAEKDGRIATLERQLSGHFRPGEAVFYNPAPPPAASADLDARIYDASRNAAETFWNNNQLATPMGTVFGVCIIAIHSIADPLTAELAHAKAELASVKRERDEAVKRAERLVMLLGNHWNGHLKLENGEINRFVSTVKPLSYSIYVMFAGNRLPGDFLNLTDALAAYDKAAAEGEGAK